MSNLNLPGHTEIVGKTDILSSKFVKDISHHSSTGYKNLQIFKCTLEEANKEEAYKMLIDELRSKKPNLYVECWIGIDEYNNEPDSSKLKDIVDENLLKKAKTLLNRGLMRKKTEDKDVDLENTPKSINKNQR